jgi:hypothetical protein
MATAVALVPVTRGITSMKAEAAPQNGDEMTINRPNDRFPIEPAPGVNCAGDRAPLLFLGVRSSKDGKSGAWQ